MNPPDHLATARRYLRWAENPDEFTTVEGRRRLYGTALRACDQVDEQWRVAGLTPDAEIGRIRKQARRGLETLG